MAIRRLVVFGPVLILTLAIVRKQIGLLTPDQMDIYINELLRASGQ